ncbi:MAG: 1-acyl-sn-glycerol-3-phosphate acyltransferase [Chitinispirillales bacterium]|nr:1-acyl-sn-glycerol-3-phosphate acyltransferase [Chitinispirillales bacterium]
MKWMVYDILSFFQVLKIKEATGLQNFHGTGIVISNHQSFFDGFLVMGHVPSVPLVKSSYKFNPFFNCVIMFFDFVEIDTTPTGIMKADEKIRRLLKSGQSVYICPEGTRNSDGKIGKFHSLAFKIAEDLKVPLFPIVIHYDRPILGKSGSSFIFSQKVDVKIHILESIIPQENQTSVQLLKEAHGIMKTEFEKMSI